MTKRTLTAICTILAAFAISASVNAVTLAQSNEQSASKQAGRALSVTAAASAPAAAGYSMVINYVTCDGCPGKPVLPGTDISYDIKYQNDGCGDVNSTWTTNVPTGTAFVSASVLSNPGGWRLTQAPGVGSGGGVGWAGSVDGDKFVVVRLTVKVATNLSNGFIVSLIASYRANTGDDSFLCGLGGVVASGSTSGNLTVRVEQPVDESHKLIQPIYQGVIDSLEAINDISANLQAANSNILSVNSNVNMVKSNLDRGLTVLDRNIESFASLVSNRFDGLQVNLNAVNNNINNRFNSVDGGINGVSNLVNARFTTLNDNFNARIGLVQDTVITVARLASQTADAVNAIRGTTVSMVSQLNTLQTSANTANAKLDVVNDKADATLNKIDAATAKVDALQNTANILNAKLDDVLSKLAAQQQNAFQFQIETALVEGDRYNIASLQMPRSSGGYLEDVRELVDRVLQASRNSGLPPSVIAQAAQELQVGDESMKAKGYKDAYEHYRAAYLHLSVVPGNRRP